MKVLFLTRLFYPHIGGVEKHVLEISKILIKKGYKVIVVAEKHQDNLRNKEEFNGITIYRIDVGNNQWFKKFKIWWWFIKHIGFLKKADIIHCHDVFFWYLPFRFLFLKKPVYTTFHGYESYPISKRAIFVRKISEILSWGNICIGDYIKKWYGTKPTYISYGG
ncbi:MAG: glycosyltransferase, partial [Candidatus Parcubacteria bacterium]|nr:glycosyltransferase [Candidatus Parcubacteria bacterium]